ncbi:MAG: hypothetical protein K0R39_3527 [Symbiobacteriaceae bacterium]|jgi:carboxyl-terminal processing protease|nr:hypothetical protein [Symbiobacteriaceae bacterium]
MKTWPTVIAALLLFLALPAILAAVRTPEPAPVAATPPPASLTSAQREEIFLNMWSQVNRDYLYFDRRDVDWEAVREQYLPLARSASDVPQFQTILRQALAEVNDSHLALYEGPGTVGRPHLWVEQDGDQIAIAWVDGGSDAEQAGLKPGMILQEVDGLPIAEVWAREEAAAAASMAANQRWLGARNVVRGPMGSETTIVAALPGQSPVKATLVRSAKPDPYVSYVGKKELPGGIVYIYIRTFADPEVIQSAEALLREVAQKKPNGLIIDVRYNRGGSLDNVTRVGNPLFAKGTILAFQKDHTAGTTLQVDTTPPTVSYTGPLVVLTNQSCGSACDILATGMQQTKRATLVGENPCGAGIRYELRNLPYGFRMLFPMAEESLDRQGQPIEQHPAQVDYRVAPTAADWAVGRDAALEKALALLATP